MTETNHTAYLLYDSKCGRCTSFMKIAKWFDHHDLLAPVPLQYDLARNLVNGEKSSEELMDSFHTVTIEKSGKRNLASGGDGLIELLKYFPVTEKVAPVAASSTFFRVLAKYVYLGLARLRGNTCESS